MSVRSPADELAILRLKRDSKDSDYQTFQARPMNRPCTRALLPVFAAAEPSSLGSAARTE